MKKLPFLLVCFLLLAGQVNGQSVENRDSLLNFFEKTRNGLLHEIEGLSSEQMQFKPSADKWSVSQCLEHIILTEQMLFSMAKDSLARPANPERRNEVKMTGDQLVAGILDRSFQAKAPEGLQPAGKYSNPSEAIKDFDAQRKEIMAFLNQVDIDKLKDHVSDSPFGPLNAYHSLLFVAGHTGRHTLQIEEVKSHPDFPGK